MALLAQILEALRGQVAPVGPAVIPAPDGVSGVITPVTLRQTASFDDRVLFEGKVYTRADNPKWFAVLDWLNEDPRRAGLSLKDIVTATEVSKPYVASARRYWQEQHD